jgi:hypothetical protein
LPCGSGLWPPDSHAVRSSRLRSVWFPPFGKNFDVIINSVERDSWLKSGTGEAEIRPLHPGMLVIANTYEVHQQIACLLTDIRETRRHIDASKDRSAALLQPITRGFKIDLELGENPDAVTDQIAESVMQSIDWDMANPQLPKEEFWLKVLPDRLLVRHLPAVVRQVERIVADMQLAP